MSRDVVFIKYNSSDELRYKYTSISVPDIYKCLEIFVEYNTSDELRYKYSLISVPDI